MLLNDAFTSHNWVAFLQDHFSQHIRCQLACMVHMGHAFVLEQGRMGVYNCCSLWKSMTNSLGHWNLIHQPWDRCLFMSFFSSFFFFVRLLYTTFSFQGCFLFCFFFQILHDYAWHSGLHLSTLSPLRNTSVHMCATQILQKLVMCV